MAGQQISQDLATKCPLNNCKNFCSSSSQTREHLTFDSVNFEFAIDLRSTTVHQNNSLTAGDSFGQEPENGISLLFLLNSVPTILKNNHYLTPELGSPRSSGKPHIKLAF